MRTFEKTHPWISFKLDLRAAPMGLWMTLGEIRSKCEHIAGVPLDSHTAELLYRLSLTRGVQATTAIEGNTLTEEQVRLRIEGKLQLPASQEYLGREVDNIVGACNKILEDLGNGKAVDLTPELISFFNLQVLEGLPVPDNVVPGRVRTYSVGVGSYRGAPAEDCEYLLQRLCDFIRTERKGIQNLDRTSISVLLAVAAHLYIAWIHPFGDGNGRTARLVEFLLLLDGGVPAPAAHLLSNHYNLTRQRYYQELERASGSGGNVVPFIEYALQGFLDGLKQQLSEIRSYQLKMIWRDYISGFLDNPDAGEYAIVRARRRELLLALSERDKPVSISEIPLLTPGIARHYAKRTRKTLSRDLNALSSLGLVEMNRDGVRAKTENVLAFLPLKKNE